MNRWSFPEVSCLFLNLVHYPSRQVSPIDASLLQYISFTPVKVLRHSFWCASPVSDSRVISKALLISLVWFVCIMLLLRILRYLSFAIFFLEPKALLHLDLKFCRDDATAYHAGNHFKAIGYTVYFFQFLPTWILEPLIMFLKPTLVTELLLHSRT